MIAGRYNFYGSVPQAENGSSVTHELKFADFECMKYGSMKPDHPFVGKDINAIGLMASVFKGLEPIPGKTGGDFTFILEKVELI